MHSGPLLWRARRPVSHGYVIDTSNARSRCFDLLRSRFRRHCTTNRTCNKYMLTNPDINLNMTLNHYPSSSGTFEATLRLEPSRHPFTRAELILLTCRCTAGSGTMAAHRAARRAMAAARRTTRARIASTASGRARPLPSVLVRVRTRNVLPLSRCTLPCRRPGCDLHNVAYAAVMASGPSHQTGRGSGEFTVRVMVGGVRKRPSMRLVLLAQCYCCATSVTIGSSMITACFDLLLLHSQTAAICLRS